MSANVIATLLASQALAGEFKVLTGSVTFELEHESIWEPDDDPQELHLLTSEIEAILKLHLTKRLFVESETYFELTVLPSTEGFHAFENEGIYAEILTLNFAGDHFGLYGGKFDPNIVTGFKHTPDLFDTELDEDELEITKRLGFGGYVDIDAGHRGTHRLSGNAFFTDTTALSQSAITNWGRTKLSDGGASNTGKPNSFFLGLYGGKIAGLKGVSYYTGLTRQAVDALDSDDDDISDASASVGNEYRLSGAIEKKVDITKTFAIAPMIEHYHFWNADGVAAETRDYLTASVEITLHRASLQLSYTGRFVRHDEGADYNDKAFEATAGYKFKSGLEASLEALYLDEAGAPYWAGSATLSRTFKF